MEVGELCVVEQKTQRRASDATCENKQKRLATLRSKNHQRKCSNDASGIKKWRSDEGRHERVQFVSIGIVEWWTQH